MRFTCNHTALIVILGNFFCSHSDVIALFNVFVACLFVRHSLLLFWDFLIDVEDAWDVEFHAVEVISNHSPKLIQTRVTSFCNLTKKKK